jgi:hypothetical protein
VRGKSSFGEPDGTKRRQSADAVKPRTILKATATTGAGLSQFEQLASLPEHLRALPPIRTKSMPEPGGGVHIQESSGRLFAGLTPHGYIGSGLTPTAVTPGSITGFPGVDRGAPGWLNSRHARLGECCAASGANGSGRARECRWGKYY